MEIVTIIGLTAAACTTVATLPQIIKSWRTRRTGDISLLFMVVLAVGLCLWLAYGILLCELPLIAGNSVGLALTLCLIALKLRYG